MQASSISDHYHLLLDLPPRFGKDDFSGYSATIRLPADENTSIGEIIGRGFEPDRIAGAIETIIDTYLSLRFGKEETFLAAYRRLGPAPFKEALYADEAKAA